MPTSFETAVFAAIGGPQMEENISSDGMSYVPACESNWCRVFFFFFECDECRPCTSPEQGRNGVKVQTEQSQVAKKPGQDKTIEHARKTCSQFWRTVDKQGT